MVHSNRGRTVTVERDHSTMPAFASIFRGSVSVIVPTRNEARNVRQMYLGLAAALGHEPGLAWELLFVDDSDDETPAVVAELAAVDPRVRLLHRAGAQRAGGLGGAVLFGFAQSASDVVLVMDGDLQHPPEDAPRMLRAFDDPAVDLVVGSRHVADGSAPGVENAFRKLASRGCEAVAFAALAL